MFDHKLLKERRKTREVAVGKLVLGNHHPIRVQSMTSTNTVDVDATVRQINALADAGCEIVRFTIKDHKTIAALPEIRRRAASIPFVADIHFNHTLAIESAPYVDKIRINPGNIGSKEYLLKVVEQANRYDLPIRIGVNLGSLERDIALKYGATEISKTEPLRPPTHEYPPQALVESALRNIQMLEECGFTRTIISVKASNVPLMIRAYQLLAEACDYPLHLGVTEAGLKDTSNIKSAIGIGSLLMQGIGDTLRVSIAARNDDEKTEEIRSGFRILQALGLRHYGIEVVVCPTCGRLDQAFDTTKIAHALETTYERVKLPIKIAVMGCIVNGPGEAADADFGIIAAGQTARIYQRGQLIQERVPQESVVARIGELIQQQYSI